VDEKLAIFGMLVMGPCGIALGNVFANSRSDRKQMAQNRAKDSKALTIHILTVKYKSNRKIHINAKKRMRRPEVSCCFHVILSTIEDGDMVLSSSL
jgi:hypothetical protein